MTPDQGAAYIDLARLLRRPGPLQNLLREVTEKFCCIVVFDTVRYDIADEKGQMWSRLCKPGVDPDRPSLGTILRLKTREELVREGDTVQVPLGFGDRPSGKIVVSRKGGFSDADVEALQRCADLFTLALRARPLEAKPKPRGPFEELGELV